MTATSSALVRSFRRWRSGASNDEFSVVDRRVYIQQSAGARDAEVVLRLFIFMARHGVKLAMETERRLNNARRALQDTMPQDARLWSYLRELLVQPHAAEALRAMHSLRLLVLALPEFETIDSLVLRDLYHRYTVDEHTFLTIATLHQSPRSGRGMAATLRDAVRRIRAARVVAAGAAVSRHRQRAGGRQPRSRQHATCASGAGALGSDGGRGQ